jgi:putative DNA primase/helicase
MLLFVGLARDGTAGFCYYRKPDATPTTQQLDDIRRILDIKAYSEGIVYEHFVRVAEKSGRLFLDLCDSEWRAIEITLDGWHTVDRPPVKFLRSASARALPEPTSGDVIERLRGFINVASDEDFQLIVSWLVAALRPGVPFPILIINGVQGTGKTILCKLLRRLIDPDLVLICAPPSNERDLVLAATNIWISAYDNLSEINGFLPDALC